MLGVARPGEANGVGSKGIGSSLAFKAVGEFFLLRVAGNQKKNLGSWGNLFKRGPEVILFLAESFPPRIGVEKFSSEKSGVKSHPVSVKVNGSVGKVTEIGRGNFLFGGKSDCNPLKY